MCSTFPSAGVILVEGAVRRADPAQGADGGGRHGRQVFRGDAFLHGQVRDCVILSPAPSLKSCVWKSTTQTDTHTYAFDNSGTQIILLIYDYITHTHTHDDDSLSVCAIVFCIMPSTQLFRLGVLY